MAAWATTPKLAWRRVRAFRPVAPAASGCPFGRRSSPPRERSHHGGSAARRMQGAQDERQIRELRMQL
jgi:hypothetical protein